MKLLSLDFKVFVRKSDFFIRWKELNQDFYGESSPNLLISSIWTPCRVIFLPSYMVTLMRYSSQGTSKSNVTILVLGLIFFLMISSVRLVEQKGPKHERKLSSRDRPPPTNCHYSQRNFFSSKKKFFFNFYEFYPFWHPKSWFLKEKFRTLKTT